MVLLHHLMVAAFMTLKIRDGLVASFVLIEFSLETAD
jgi:hypothetical protein